MQVIDITGQTFGRLTVVKRTENDHRGKAMWICRCECGKEVIACGRNLRNGHTRSCGCLLSEKTVQRNLTHGLSRTRLHNIWKTMHQRCTNPKSRKYKRYGGRGIKVCDEWMKDFEAFHSWALANGYADNLTIDRINNDGNYEPSNCRWATYKEQANNKTQRKGAKYYESQKHGANGEDSSAGRTAYTE